MSPLTVRKAVSLVTTPGPGTNCAATQSQRSPTSAQPLSTPPQNPHWLMASLWEHSAFTGSGSPLATAVSASRSCSKIGRRVSAACCSIMASAPFLVPLAERLCEHHPSKRASANRYDKRYGQELLELLVAFSENRGHADFREPRIGEVPRIHLLGISAHEAHLYCLP